MAALDDEHDQVKEYAFWVFSEYKRQDLKSVVKKPEDIARKAVTILKDESVDDSVRSSAAYALGHLGETAQPYVKDIANILKDESVDDSVRSLAAYALGHLGETAQPYVKDIATILKDESVDDSVRRSAAEALGNLGETAQPYVKDIATILKDESVDDSVRRLAAEALGNLGETAQPYVEDIANILKDESVDDSVRGSAAEALGNLGETAQPYVKDIATILKDESVDDSVRGSAAVALGNLGETAQPYVEDILNFIKDESVDDSVRVSAAVALGNLGETAQPYVEDILNFIKDESVDYSVRARAAEALGNLGETAQPYVEDIANILKDESVDDSVRRLAAEALGNLGETAQPYVKDIANILKDESVDDSVRARAAEALGHLGETAQPYVKDILNFIKDESVEPDDRHSAAYALRNIQKLKPNEVVVVLNNVYEPNTLDVKLPWRFFTYFLSGGTDEVKTLLKWLGNPQDTPTQLNYADGKQTLNIFLDIWESCQDLEGLRKDLAEQIAIVAANKQVPWRWQDIGLLKRHHDNLQAVYPTKATAVESAINDLEFWRWVFTARNIIIAHIIFWLALIFAYPKSPQIQAIFFWNPWVRKILGMGYVGFLLTWVPFLRRKLFEPFKPSLLADAELNDFDDFAYFPESKVKVLESGEIQAITAAIPSIQGQIIVVGDSGLGKSMFLHHLVKHSRRILVYLPAQNCQDGVIAAIQAKLHGQAQDDQFLKSLIYSGAIDICIDALNEVSADTRSQIKQFVQTYFQGNIIITTQPLEWVPPSTAKRYDLQPLEPPQIEQFLLSRRQGLPQNAQVKGIEYEKACQSYLAAALNPQQSPEELEGVQRILSNPMDLTLVSLMLSQGKHPNLFRLQEQHYQMMAAEYQQEWHHEFPLNKFSEAVYQMRLKDEKALPADEFNQELSSLIADSMIKRRLFVGNTSTYLDFARYKSLGVS